MSAIAEAHDAGSVVRGQQPPPGTEGAYVDGLRDDCGLLVGGMLHVVHTLTGHDLLEDLLRPIAGDHDAVDSMRSGWREVGVACAAVGDNYDALADQLPAVWEGEGAAAAVRLTRRVAAAHRRQREAADLVADQLGHVLAVSRATAECVCSVLHFLDGLVQEILLDAATGPLGWAKGAVTAPAQVRRLVALVRRGMAAIEALLEAVRAAVAALRLVDALVDTVGMLLDGVNAAAHTTAGRRVDETARAGF